MEAIESRRRIRLLLWCFMCAALPGAAQVAEQRAPAPRGGFSIRETSFYSSYYFLGLPVSAAGPSAIGSDLTMGVSTGLAFDKTGERTNFSLLYNPSFTGRVRYSDWTAFSNALNMNLSRAMTGRLRFNLSAAGAVRNREESQFGQILNAPLTMLSPTAPLTDPIDLGLGDTAAQSLFFGGRLLTASARVGFQYALSPRLSLSAGVGGTRMQTLQSQNSAADGAALIPNVSALLGDFGVMYTLTPRTSIGVTVDTSRQRSRLQDALITNARFSIDRALSRHWFVHAYGGVGQFRSLQNDAPTIRQLQYITGGGATYRRAANTFIASFDRRISDIYGVGASNTRGLSGTWTLAPLRSRVWMALGISRTEFQSILFPTTTWRGTATVGHRIAGNLAIVGTYAHLGYSNPFVQSSAVLSQRAIRVALSWNPLPQAAAAVAQQP